MSDQQQNQQYYWMTAALALSLGAAACQGDKGDPGPSGRAGADGMMGQKGDPGDPGDQGPPGRDATLDPALSSLEKAFAGAGGEEALAAMTSFQMMVTTARSIAGEGYSWDDGAVQVNTTTATISAVLADNDWRVDVSRVVQAFGLSIPQTYSIYLLDGRGHVAGVESIFQIPTGDMLSDGVAASVKELRLLNPHVILREIAADPSIAEDAGFALLDGNLHHLLVVEDAIHPITLWVNVQTGRISKASTVENSPVERDVELTAFYLGWTPAGDSGVAFPSQVVLAVGPDVVLAETRSSVTVNPVFAPEFFDLPMGAMPMFDATAADRGARSSQFHQGFAALGLRQDGLQLNVMTRQLGPGVYLVAGGSHNSLAVEQANGVVIVEPPLNNERSRAVIDWAEAQFPAKPISHIVVTHFHHDHSGGFREFLAEGADLVIGEASEPLYRHSIHNSSTIVPDSFARADITPAIITVPAGGELTLPDAMNPVRLLTVDNTHADDMLTAYVPSAGVVFVSDLYNPGLPQFPLPWPREYYDSLIAGGLNLAATATVAGGHGSTSSFGALRMIAGR